MRRALALVASIALGAAAAAQAGGGMPLPELLRVAVRLSGLQPHETPRVVTLSQAALKAKALAIADRDYPPAAQAFDERVYRALGLLGPGERLRGPLVAAETSGVAGVYDAASRTVYVGRGKAARAAAVVELVHALQDQSYGVRRAMSVQRRGRDAALAAAAASEGAAQLMTQTLPGGALVRRAALSADSSKIAQFLALEHGFPAATGMRFAVNLNNVGGTKAVRESLRRLPTTTAQVFHLDAYLQHRKPQALELPGAAAGYALLRDDTFGELDVRALLAVFQVPRLNVVADGWGAGLYAEYGGPGGSRAVALRLDWQTGLDAAEWAEAVQTYVNEAFDAATPGLPQPAPCAATICWDVGGRGVALLRSEARTALVVGSSVADAAALANAAVPGA